MQEKIDIKLNGKPATFDDLLLVIKKEKEELVAIIKRLREENKRKSDLLREIGYLE